MRKSLFASAALAILVGAASSFVPASAQNYPYQPPPYPNQPPPVANPYGMPPYTTWQPTWDQWQYDQRHVKLGMVVNFSPYRLTLQHRNGMEETVDLKNGTMIFPQGATPTQGERAAIIGYYSNGTFIANRVVLRA
jgi:hypothetical protein